MNTKFDLHKEGLSKNYGYVEFRSQTGDEEAKLASLFPGKGFHIEIERIDSLTVRITPVPNDPGDDVDVSGVPGTPAYTNMKRPQLLTVCAEKGVKYEKTDKVADLIEKLRKHDG